MRKIFIQLVWVTVIIAASSSAVQASQGLSSFQSQHMYLLSAGSQITREEAISIAKTVFNGKVLKVKKQQSDAGLVYAVKILSKEGRVRLVKVLVATGEPL